ncbi:MAG: hypothetical protein LRY54_04965 [Alphaproteobacteria bacterium]|nr:hypothetical protein [Alphaproteobacteria bacterium]
MSLAEKLAAAKKAATQQAAQTQATTATPEAETEAFKVTDAAIKSNPAYKIITDESKTYQQIVAELKALRAFNPALTPEENTKNLEAVEQLLTYFENAVMAAAREGNQFTNDNALSLFDDMVKSLQGRLVEFNGYIKPFVRAFDVMQKARGAGIKPHELLGEVQKLKDKKAAMEDEKSTLLKDIGAAEEAITPIQEKATRAADKLTSYGEDIAAAEKVIQEEEAKNFFSRDRKALKLAQEAKQRAADGIKALGGPAEVVAKELAAQEEKLAGLRSKLTEAEAQIEAANTELTADEDTVAIGRLLEITGPAFKAEREKIVTLVNSINEDSVKDIEKTATRFASGQQELNKVSGQVENISYFNRMLFDASKQAKEVDDQYAAELDATMAAIKAEKGDEAHFDPDFVKAEKRKRDLNKTRSSS